MEARVKTQEDLERSGSLYLFGRDVTQIPCFRKSFIFGICGGVVGGLACFLATSKALFSTHIAFASLWISVFGYWIPCRYNYEVSNIMYHEARRQGPVQIIQGEIDKGEQSS